MSQYFFSKEAEKDLIDIYRYGFLAHGKHQAEQYLQSLKEKCQFLATNPKLSHERREFTPPIRINGHKQHLIIYLSNEDSITVVRILHKKMDVPNHLDH
ncbi:plasmid stabilization protein ParE [Methylococcaceae bacterium HT5]|nr:plasmid stabilization protein ParE [Methylococcaceae bacterium HT5]